MMSQPFNATDELQRIQHYRNVRKNKPYQRSRLNKFRAELVSMHNAGGSLRDLQLWLTKVKRCKVSHTTIMRFLARLPELQIQSVANGEPNHAELSPSKDPG